MSSVAVGSWGRLEGSFYLAGKPERAVFYLEGPAPGVDLLIQSVEITNPYEYHHASSEGDSAGDENFAINPTFDDG
ncbi:hypothetical protein QN277_015378 [Acacia crassicarpa]|uniref:Uncharacterized protein n=1 Tax=Acacia crassicarpa TaxID=499986 RepID=A0AAE1JXG4_9FABA|nr:hypothetical protein QN277_015378 [Acacia crassicarpa]